MAKLVSKVYGDALFEAAQETKCLDETFEQVLALQEILKEHEDLIQLLNHPQVVKEEKIQRQTPSTGAAALSVLHVFPFLPIFRNRSAPSRLTADV